MKPRAIIIGDGIWFVWNGKKNYVGFQKALRTRLKSIMELAGKVS